MTSELLLRDLLHYSLQLLLLVGAGALLARLLPLRPATAAHMARLPQSAQQLLLPLLGVGVGDAIDEATAKRVHEAVKRFDEHLRVSFSRNDAGGIALLIVGPEDGR